jgi:two-component sensor histidine kinase
MPFAIILNEAISNAFKHAFKKGQKGTIRISLKETGENTVSLKIKDDGVGFPEGIDIHNAQTLGLKLMRNLVRDQLKGQIKVEKNRGTEVIVEFKPLNEEGKDEKNIGC